MVETHTHRVCKKRTLVKDSPNILAESCYKDDWFWIKQLFIISTLESGIDGGDWNNSGVGGKSQKWCVKMSDLYYRCHKFGLKCSRN